MDISLNEFSRLITVAPVEGDNVTTFDPITGTTGLLATCKQAARADDTSDFDALFTSYIQTLMKMVEDFTGLCLTEKVFILLSKIGTTHYYASSSRPYWACKEELRASKNYAPQTLKPLLLPSSVLSVSYTGFDGIEVALEESEYIVDLDRKVVLLPLTKPVADLPDGWKIRLKAGCASSDDLAKFPQVTTAISLATTYWFRNPEAFKAQSKFDGRTGTAFWDILDSIGA